MLNRIFLAIILLITNAEANMTINAHNFAFTAIDGTELPLNAYKDKVLLVVNTASRCGFKSQFNELQELQEKYQDQGLVVIAVPSSDFGNQELASEVEVQEFMDKDYKITFPMTIITHVSGKNAHPFYEWANAQAGFLGKPKWNFHKYLIGKDGNLVEWFASTTSPLDKKVTTTIEVELLK